MNTTCNALSGVFYMRNLFSVLLACDIEQHEIEQWLSCADGIPSLTLESTERWLSVTKETVAVWSHRGEGVTCTVWVWRKRNRALGLGRCM